MNSVGADFVLPDYSGFGNLPAGDLQIILDWIDTNWGAGTAVTTGTLAAYMIDPVVGYPNLCTDKTLYADLAGLSSHMVTSEPHLCTDRRNYCQAIGTVTTSGAAGTAALTAYGSPQTGLKLDINFPDPATAPTTPGVICMFGGTVAPGGWVFCDGQAYDGTNPTYAGLFAAIGTAWGDGTIDRDGNPGVGTTFNAPDFRGLFPRGALQTYAGGDRDQSPGTTRVALKHSGASYGGNAGNAVGSYQGDSVKNHKHQMGDLYGVETTTWFNPLYAPGVFGITHLNRITGNNLDGTVETRPMNVYVPFIIKL